MTSASHRDARAHDAIGETPGRRTPPVGRAGVFQDLLPLALWVVDADGVLVQWSLAAQDLLGHTSEQMVGQDARRVLVPEGHLELADGLSRTVRTGAAVVARLPVRHRDGTVVDMELWHCPIADVRGRPGVLAIAAETSAVERMRDALAALEGLFTQSPVGLAMLGADLRFLRVNEALARMDGVPVAEHIGRRVTEVAPGTEALESMMRRVLDRGEAVVDHRHTGADAADPEQQRTWSCSYAPLLGAAGQRAGVIASLIDVTEGQRAHLEVERARRRLALLAEAGTQMGSTLDLARTAREVVRVLVPRLADSADVQLLEEAVAPDETAASAHGVVRRVAAAFTDPAAPADHLSVGMTQQVPPGSVYEQVIGAGRPMNLYLSDIGPLIPTPGADRLREYLRARVGCARLVPLVARGTVLGAVVVTRTRDREPFDDQDTLLIDELVARAALNIDNARMYSRERDAALTLQRSLMNPVLPTVSGLELTGRYLPAGDHEVGGDWFDAIALSGGRTALVIGDVMGHGIHAAAVMGQLRTAVRTLARRDTAPDQVLRALDAAVADLGDNEMATCLYAVHDPVAGHCLIARAGHPPPMIADGRGTIAFLDGPPGPPLGLGGQDCEVQRMVLPPRSLLVAYTDGLIETRGTDLDQGMRRLAQALRHPGHPLEEICDELLAHVMPETADDDVAVLLARAQPR
ncbi:SpoIIE family protein phosphatase [Streptomyces ferrugineus]|uniref:protein-serine/threonine phosphatase n=1 Tax=Streptomyces ferrugineus TaxID=1413221 RepID=A0A7M2SBZ8_9ACTN|nr:SpoIIE family protein phosphatase [Streptomyces ferrugineus]QOV33822.1 SpoIIE family protein phosphatase [Streptomyces ferrugineus]